MSLAHATSALIATFQSPTCSFPSWHCFSLGRTRENPPSLSMSSSSCVRWARWRSLSILRELSSFATVPDRTIPEQKEYTLWYARRTFGNRRYCLPEPDAETSSVSGEAEIYASGQKRKGGTAECLGCTLFHGHWLPRRCSILLRIHRPRGPFGNS